MKKPHIKTLLTLVIPFSLFILMNPHNLSLQTKLCSHLGINFSGKHHSTSNIWGKNDFDFTPKVTASVVFSTKGRTQMTM